MKIGYLEEFTQRSRMLLEKTGRAHGLGFRIPNPHQGYYSENECRDQKNGVPKGYAFLFN
jgi:hypothetical protein